jgi:hypothetical protein
MKSLFSVRYRLNSTTSCLYRTVMRYSFSKPAGHEWVGSSSRRSLYIMQLLGASTTPTPEFVSVSLLLKQDWNRNEIHATLGEPLIIASPLATVDCKGAVDALTELHTHLTFMTKALSQTIVLEQEDAFTASLLQNDIDCLSGVQLFRPLAARGVGLYYRLIQGSALSVFSSLGLASNQGNTSSVNVDPSKLHGAVLCVGVSGLGLAQCSSSILYSLPQRMNDCISILSRAGDEDTAAARSVLSSFLPWWKASMRLLSQLVRMVQRD